MSDTPKAGFLASRLIFSVGIGVYWGLRPRSSVTVMSESLHIVVTSFVPRPALERASKRQVTST